MPTGIPPLDILLASGQHIFAFDFGRYLIAASVTFAVVWLLRRTALKARKIQPREATAADMRREFAQSLQSVFVYMIGICFLIWGREAGLFYDVSGVSFGIGIDLLILAAIIIAHDAYFYWTHRFMHQGSRTRGEDNARAEPRGISQFSGPPRCGTHAGRSARVACRAGC